MEWIKKKSKSKRIKNERNITYDEEWKVSIPNRTEQNITEKRMKGMEWNEVEKKKTKRENTKYRKIFVEIIQKIREYKTILHVCRRWYFFFFRFGFRFRRCHTQSGQHESCLIYFYWFFFNYCHFFSTSSSSSSFSSLFVSIGVQIKSRGPKNQRVETFQQVFRMLNAKMANSRSSIQFYLFLSAVESMCVCVCLLHEIIMERIACNDIVTESKLIISIFLKNLCCFLCNSWLLMLFFGKKWISTLYSCTSRVDLLQESKLKIFFFRNCEHFKFLGVNAKVRSFAQSNTKRF